MSTYGYRISELREGLQSLPAPANDRITETLNDCLNRYQSLRQAALDDLVDYLARASASNTGTQSKWQSRISRLRSDYNSLFGDAVRDFKLPPGHQLYWATAVQAEETYFEALSRVGTPQLMDDLLKHQDDLSKLIGVLQDTWTFLLSKNQGLQNDEMRSLQDMDKLVQDILAELDSSVRAVLDNSGRAVEAITRVTREFKDKVDDTLGRFAAVADTLLEILKKLVLDDIKPDGTPDEMEEPFFAVLKDLELRAQALADRARTYRTLLSSYKDLLSTQKGSVLTVFKKTRDDINGYLNNNNVGKARSWMDQARGQLNDWASAAPMNGQKADGALFRDDVGKAFDATWKITLELDEKFRRQFEGAFVSSISNDTLETLAGSYLFKQQVGRVNDRDTERKLSDYRDKVTESLQKLEEGIRKQDPVDALRDTVPSEVRDLVKSRNEGFRDFVHDRIKRQMEVLLPSIEELRKTFARSNVESDFSRRDLEDMLR